MQSINNDLKDNIIESLKEDDKTPLIINFYNCAFNFGNESTAESKVTRGDENYNRERN